MSGKTKILFLESLRGIAAVSIVLYHSHLPQMMPGSNIIRNLPFMVDFFFVLSGFVIALNYQGRISSFRDVMRFQRRRFLRLYPLHLVLLLVFLLLEISKYLVQDQFGIVAANPAFSRNNVSSFLHNLLLTHNLFLDYSSWNFVSWSISAEFYTYILFALVIYLSMGARFVMLIASSVIMFASLLYLANHSFTAEHGLIRCFYSFFMGVLVFNVCQAVRVKISRHFSYIFFGLAIVALQYATQSVAVLIPVLFSLLILSLVVSEEKNGLIKFLDRKSLVYLGTISYGIYMIHPLVWWICTQVLRFVFEYPTYVSEGNFTVVAFDSDLTAYAVLVLGLLLVVLLAHWSYRLIELPCSRLQRGVRIRAGLRLSATNSQSF